MTAMSFSVRIAAFFGALFLAIGIYLPFFPVWLKARGLSDAEVALVLATPMVRILAGPALSFLADRLGDRRIAVVSLCVLALAGFAVLLVVDGFWPIFLVCLAIGIVWTSILPIAETIAVGGSLDRGVDYGRLRLWGSLTFIAGSLGAGVVVGQLSGDAVLSMLIAALFLAVLAALALPETSAQEAPAAEPLTKLRLSDVRALFTSGMFPVFLIAAGLTQATHALYYAFGTIHWQGQGIGDGTIGTLWSIGVLAEIALFAFSGRVLAWIGPARLLIVGASAAVARWCIMAAEPGLAVLVVTQILHAATYGATHLGTMHFIARAVPRRLQATAQGIYSALAAGILMSGLVACSGLVYQQLAGLAYLVMAAIAAISLCFAVYLRMRWPSGPVSGVTPKEDVAEVP